jgi:uncharacterized membrane protein
VTRRRIKATIPPVPASFSPRSAVKVWSLTFCGSIVWLAAIFLAPWLSGRGASGAARFVYAAFAPFCHQIAERCFVVSGHPLAVCGRCLGIYAGFAAGLILYPFVQGFARISLPQTRLFLMLTLPMAVDAVASLLGIWSSPIELRFVTGFAWGTILPFYFVTGVIDFLRTRKIRVAARALEKTAPTK